MLEFLPKRLYESVKVLGEKNVYELRIRKNAPVTVNFRGEYAFLSPRGISSDPRSAYISDAEEIAETVYRAGKFSVYSVEEEIRRGFVSAEGGVRVGIAGEYVFENGKVAALKNPTSLCVRVPHRVPNAGAEVYEIAAKRGLKNVLIVSAPGRGKTTVLRDLAEKIARNKSCNLLVCDERGEIAPCGALEGADVISYVDKKQAFEMAIRALRPDVIVTDELSEEDLKEVKKAIRSGVFVAASAHFDGINCLTDNFRGVFDCYVTLAKDGVGKIDGVYGKNFEKYDEKNRTD